jgi:hypothetical protein
MSVSFPRVIDQSGRRFFLRSALDAYKMALAGLPYEKPTEPEELVPIRQAAHELGVCVRTLGRRIAESRATADKQAA